MKLYKYLSILLISVVFFTACNKDDGGTDPKPTAQSIGVLVSTPSTIMANQPTDVVVRLYVPAGVQIKDSTVKVYRANDDGSPSSEMYGMIYDNGKLTNEDEILGDNVFSGKFTITQTTAGNLRLVAVGTYKNEAKDGNSDLVSIQVVAELKPQDVATVYTVQANASNQLNTYLAGNINNLESAVNQLETWLKAQPSVENVEKSATTLEIQYKSGIYGGIVIVAPGSSGNVEFRGGFGNDPKRKNSESIPVSKQTVGVNKYYTNNSFAKKQVVDPTVIGNRNVLIYAPFEAAFHPWNEGQKIVSILNSSGFEFSIDYYKNSAANIEVLMNLTNYGYVVLATHGSGGNSFATGEEADTNSNIFKTKYKPLYASGKIAIWKQVTVGANGNVAIKKDIYAIRHTFLGDLPGTFPNSVILNNSCESTKSLSLYNAFAAKGAKSYYGYTHIVSSSYCVVVADTITRRLAKELKTTGNAYIPGKDPNSNAVLELKGATDVHYSDELINGDFEYGKIFGWTVDGDGRVISQLGTEKPTGGNFMGIISTGLGYTTATGSIQQTFTIGQNQTTLAVKWNFLSEEFLEYIGSQYQDYFKIEIKGANGQTVALFSRTVDQIAAQFGATKEDAGNLIKVSPGIVFDRGDVYMTGWQSSTFDVSAYKGQRVTLYLRAGDVGDSIYDTAILLDDISIK